MTASLEFHEDDWSGAARCAGRLADLLAATAAGQDLTKSALDSAETLLDELEVSLGEFDGRDPAPAVIGDEVERQLVMLDVLLEAAPTAETRQETRPAVLFPRTNELVDFHF